MKGTGGFILLFCLSQALAQVEVSPREVLVAPGKSVNLSCSLPNQPLDFCKWRVPNGKTVAKFSLKDGKAYTNELNAVYLGRGLDSGDCGMTIPSVTDANSGEVECGVSTEGHDKEGVIKLIVAKTPSPPRITVLSREPQHDSYQAGDILRASCESTGGRPAPNMTWYIGNEQITEDIQERKTEVSNGIFNVVQNITRTLKAQDAGQNLVCVIGHFTPPEKSDVQLPLRVKFPPEPHGGIIKQYGVQVGDRANVTVRIRANPKPRMQWQTDKYVVEEGSSDAEYGVSVLPTELNRDGLYETTLVINQVTEEDVNREYRLTATNAMGVENYLIHIDTSLPPKGPEMTAGVIVGIVVAVVAVFILLFVVVFARATGRWCFAGAPRHAGETKADPEDPSKTEEAKRLTDKSVSTRVSTNSEQLLGQSSDTESADHGPTHKKTSKRKGMINFTTVFKKAKDKVAGDSEALKNVTVIEEKDAEKAATIEIQQEPSTPPIAGKEPKEGVVYAELDLQATRDSSRPTVVVRPDDDKTEYAEIIHTKNKDPPAGK